MSGNENSSGRTASRRALVGGFVGVGVGVPLLAACGSDSASSSADSKSSEGTSSEGTGAGGTTSPGALANKSEVPVGGGKIYPADKVVITQPTEGTFKAFSAVCTHQGCVVAQIKGKDIDCTCHGSKFSIEDGSVLAGPATKPLEELKVTVTGNDLTVA